MIDSGKYQDINGELRPFIPLGNYLALPKVPYLWNLNSIVFEKGRLYLRGWMLPMYGRKDETTLLVNGRVAEQFAPTASRAVADLYPWWPNALWSEFNCSISLVVDSTKPDGRGLVVFDPVPIARPSPVDIRYRFYFDLSDVHMVGPDMDVQRRIGSDSGLHFCLLGCTLAHQFQRAFATYAPNRPADDARYLDWGCGSGRVARHFRKFLSEGQTLIGADIDAQATQWGRESEGLDLRVCDLMPPLPVPDNHFDYSYAYSVLTHLEVPTAKAWIEEIHRVMRPGALFLFTILSDTALCMLYPNPKEEHYRTYVANGFTDSAWNSQLESIGVSGDYYRNVWFSLSEVSALLAGRFEIVAVEQNFHFYQDLVCCVAI